MKKYNLLSWTSILRLTILVFLVNVLNSCEHDLETGYPAHLLSNEAAFENVETIEAIFADIYAGLRDNSPLTGGLDGMSVLLGLYTDELNFYRADSQIDNAFFNHVI